MGDQPIKGKVENQKFCETCMKWVDDYDGCGICPYCGNTNLCNDSTDFEEA